MTAQRSTTKKAELKKEKLLTSAKAEFIRHGYAKSTMAGVAAAAGLNKATLYYYFPGGKSELLTALVEKLGADDHVALCAAIGQKTSRRGRLTAYLRCRVERRHAEMKGNGMTTERLFELFPIAKRESAAWEQRERELIASVLEPDPECEPQQRVRALRIAELIRRSTLGWLLEHDQGASDEDTQQYLDAFVSLIADGALRATES